MTDPYDILTDLAACLCAQIETDGSPPTCFCGVIPGSAITPEYGGDCSERCGTAWVRLDNSYPSSTVGLPDEQPGNCGKGLGLDIEVGILRCMPVGDARGNPPTPEQYAATLQQQIKDMRTMKKAILCCSAIPNKGTILRNYAPFGPDGGMVGGTWGVATLVL